MPSADPSFGFGMVVHFAGASLGEGSDVVVEFGAQGVIDIVVTVIRDGWAASLLLRLGT